MRSVFLSDAHLKKRTDRGYTYLLSFFETLKRDTDHLFLVGDFFDFWFSNNTCIYPEFQEIVDKILELKKAGIHIHFYEGNHDFFMRNFFSVKHDIEVIPDASIIEVEGKKIYISHGDMIDTSDRSYRILRRILRSGLFLRMQEKIPPAILWKIAGAFSKVSQELLGESQESLETIMRAFSYHKLEEGLDAVILGHCHRPILEKITLNGGEKYFVSLGDWINHFSYLEFKENKFQLLFYNR
jgi:UDP-2,3-diacylglucosamine hydrolase